MLEPELSVIVPLYNEQENIPELHRRLTAAIGPLAIDYELIFVNDGSRDDTPRLLDERQAEDPHLVVLHLSRNFGHQAAHLGSSSHAGDIRALHFVPFPAHIFPASVSDSDQRNSQGLDDECEPVGSVKKQRRDEIDQRRGSGHPLSGTKETWVACNADHGFPRLFKYLMVA